MHVACVCMPSGLRVFLLLFAKALEALQLLHKTSMDRCKLSWCCAHLVGSYKQAALLMLGSLASLQAGAIGCFVECCICGKALKG